MALLLALAGLHKAWHSVDCLFISLLATFSFMGKIALHLSFCRNNLSGLLMTYACILQHFANLGSYSSCYCQDRCVCYVAVKERKERRSKSRVKGSSCLMIDTPALCEMPFAANTAEAPSRIHVGNGECRVEDTAPRVDDGHAAGLVLKAVR